jgi:hypothetical protein
MTSEATQHLGGNVNGVFRENYLAWVKSVLYLNPTNPGYFCACVEAIQGALPLVSDTDAEASWKDQNIGLSIERWLMLNTYCDTPSLWKGYQATRKSQFEDWYDQNAQWKLAHPLDTTLPPLSTWGLDTLFAKHFQFAEVRGTDNFASSIPSYSVTKNPTDGQTELRFTLGSEAYVRVQVCDVLGRAVAGDERGRILSLGEHRMPLDLSSNPPGTYYLRISLGTGEARTIKVVKE